MAARLLFTTQLPYWNLTADLQQQTIPISGLDSLSLENSSGCVDVLYTTSSLNRSHPDTRSTAEMPIAPMALTSEDDGQQHANNINNNGPTPPTASSATGIPSTTTASGPSHPQTDGTDSQQPPLKRQRVSQACATCRDRKTRCDGTQPVCRACEQRGVGASCRYDQIKRQRARPSYGSPQHVQSQSQSGAQPDFRPVSDLRADPRNDAAQALSDLGRGQYDGKS